MSFKKNDFVNPMHVRIDSSLDTRKEILRTAIDVTKLLQELSDFKKVRSIKAQKITALYDELHSLRASLNDFRKKLPELEEKKPEPKQVVVQKNKKVEPVEEVKPYSHEIDRLKEELNEIERRLRSS